MNDKAGMGGIACVFSGRMQSSFLSNLSMADQAGIISTAGSQLWGHDPIACSTWCHAILRLILP